MSREKFDWSNFETLRNDICHCLINYEDNKERLELVPNVRVLDLAVIFYYKSGHGFNKGAIIHISNNDLKRWNISVEQLYKVAKKNTVKLLPLAFQTIERAIDDIAKEENLPSPCEGEPKERMYVLTNEEKYLGANTILYPETMEVVYQRLGADFFILPASMHEVIIMPDVGNVIASKLQSLVVDMNKHFLEEDEVLSNSVYRYDTKAKKIVKM